MIYTAAVLRKMNITGTMTMISGTDEIKFSDGIVLNSISLKEKTKLWNKLIRMGYDRYRGNNNNGDEFDGLCQANELGLDFPECTIMCSDPELNESPKCIEFKELAEITSNLLNGSIFSYKNISYIMTYRSVDVIVIKKAGKGKHKEILIRQ
jgi:hypothetical protein